MRRADRLFQIVQLLRARGLLSAAQLGDELGVSIRTIYRDIDDLRESGVPVLGEAGVGFQLQKGFELPPMTFDAEEIEALVAGARMIQRWADPELGAAARRAIAKVEAVLPPMLRDRVKGTPLYAPRIDGAAPRVEGISPVDGPDTLGMLRRAIAARRKVALRYVRKDGHYAERRVRPVGLFFWGTGWSLAAWCELRQDWRSFRPDRMREAAPLDETWDDPDVTLEAFLAAMERDRYPAD
jgi:predicted DNA-binding transcriptional regulator YafY